MPALSSQTAWSYAVRALHCAQKNSLNYCCDICFLDARLLPCKCMESLSYLTILTGVPLLIYSCRMGFYCISHPPGSIPQIPIFLKHKQLTLLSFSYSFISGLCPTPVRTRNILGFLMLKPSSNLGRDVHLYWEQGV